MEDLFFNLRSAVVVDRTKLNKVPSAELPAVLAQLSATSFADSKPLVVIDSIRGYFSKNSVLEALNTGDPSLNLRLEFNNVLLPDSALNTITAFLALREQVITQLTPPLPPYEFAAVPTDFDVDKSFTFLVRGLRRTSGGYTISYPQAQLLWEVASKFWSGVTERSSTSVRLKVNSYRRNAEIRKDYVNIGCQRVERYEVEQIALKQGWPFPSAD